MMHKLTNMEDNKNEINNTLLSRIIYCCLVLLIAIGSLIYFTGCSPTQKVERNLTKEVSITFPESYMITSKNYFDYQSGLECAAFSSAYILRHYGKEASGMELFKNFPGKVSDGGVSPYGIVDFFKNKGYEVEFKCDGTIEELKGQLSKGVPVIAFIRVDEHHVYTHYVPLVGYDNEYFYFAESLPYMANCKDEKDVSYNRKTKISTFKQLWNNIDGRWNNPYFIISKKFTQ